MSLNTENSIFSYIYILAAQRSRPKAGHLKSPTPG